MIEGRKSEIPYKGQTMPVLVSIRHEWRTPSDSLPQYTHTLVQICQSRNAAFTNFHWKLSSCATLTAPSSPSSLKSWYLSLYTTNARSSSVRNVAVSGKSYSVKYATIATTTVSIPSRMKIHLHPARFPTPSMCAMPYASSPENAPATLAALKNSACRNWASCLAYLSTLVSQHPKHSPVYTHHIVI
jgi:hypothetical protein